VLGGGSEEVINVLDKTSHHFDVVGSVAGGRGRPLLVPNVFNGNPAFLGGDGQTPVSNACLFNELAPLFASVTDPFAVVAVIRPFGLGACFTAGGCVTSFGLGLAPSAPLGSDLYLGIEACGPTSGQQYVQNNGNHGDSSPLFAVTPVNYLGQDLLVTWEFDGISIVHKINGAVIPLVDDTPGTNDGDPGFMLMSSNHQSFSCFTGYLGATACYGQSTVPAAMLVYLSTKYGV
jgi:hypothetical protein